MISANIFLRKSTNISQFHYKIYMKSLIKEMIFCMNRKFTAQILGCNSSWLLYLIIYICESKILLGMNAIHGGRVTLPHMICIRLHTHEECCHDIWSATLKSDNLRIRYSHKLIICMSIMCQKYECINAFKCS